MATNLAFELFRPDPAPPTGTAFRPIHYLGSKLRLASEIFEAVHDSARPKGAVVDLFAGSGTVSSVLSPWRRVVAVDIQEYSRVLCSAILKPPSDEQRLGGIGVAARKSNHSALLTWALEPLLTYERECIQLARTDRLGPLCRLVEGGSLSALRQTPDEIQGDALRTAARLSWARLETTNLTIDPGSIVCRQFGGLYFSFAQAVELDGLLEFVNALEAGVRDFYLAAVLSTASEIVNTVGKQFAQPMRLVDSTGAPKRQLVRQTLRDRSMSVAETFDAWLERYHELPRPDYDHDAIRSDYRDFLAKPEIDIGVIYADPPYTRDHYSRFYHVLETMCLRDNPHVSQVTTRGRHSDSRGYYRSDRHQSPFCIKSQVAQAFESLFQSAERLGCPLVVSYSPYPQGVKARPRLLTVGQLTALAKSHFAAVEVRAVENVAHNKLNSTMRNFSVVHEAEVLVICRSRS